MHSHDVCLQTFYSTFSLVNPFKYLYQGNCYKWAAGWKCSFSCLRKKVQIRLESMITMHATQTWIQRSGAAGPDPLFWKITKLASQHLMLGLSLTGRWWPAFSWHWVFFLGLLTWTPIEEQLDPVSPFGKISWCLEKENKKKWQSWIPPPSTHTALAKLRMLL